MSRHLEKHAGAVAKALSPLPSGERVRVRGLRLFARLAVILTAITATQPANADDNTRAQTVIFCGNKEPLLIELQITIGDQAFTAAWRNGLNAIIRQLDKDKNGVLTRNETDQPNKEPPADPNQPAVAQKATDKKPRKPIPAPLLQTPSLWEADAEPRDGKLTPDEIAAFLGRQGRGAFQTEASNKTDALLSPQPTNTNNSGERLLSWLDQDGNRQLSAEELRTAPRTLRKYDLDADETISLNELQGVENPFFRASQSNQTTETPFFAVPSDRSKTRIVRKLMTRYARPEISRRLITRIVKEDQPEDEKTVKVRGVPPEVLKMPKGIEDRFDRDGNGTLDEFELRAYLETPQPMVKVRVQLPTDAKEEPTFSGTVTAEKSPVTVKKTAAGTLSLMAGDIQIEIDAGGLRPEMVMESLEERFKQADGDNNGYLEQNESNRDVFFRNHFKTYDTDSDGKLYPEEWQPPVTDAIQFARSHTRMTVQDAGQDLFAVLDADRNLRISPREWLTAADRLTVWDKNGSGSLDSGEIPHVYRVSFGPGLPDLPGLLSPQNGNTQNPTMQQLVKGPKWFQAMDKNSDGDVSIREFLGKPELFRRLDQDQDNLIDPREAARFSN